MNFLIKKLKNLKMEFFDACRIGDLKKAKEIFENKEIDIHAKDEEAFRWACHYGRLEIAKWLLYISEEKKLICESSAIASQADRYPLCGLGVINIHAKDEYAFRYTCQNGHLEVAKWLIEISEEKELGTINIHYNNEEAFRWACRYSYLEVVKWLIEISEEKKLICGSSAIASQADNDSRKGLGVINIHARNEYAFRWACRNGYYDIAKWLLTFYSYRELINLNYCSVIIKEEIENRKKNRISLILYLFENKFKLLDIHAIAIVWKEYL